MKNLKYNPYKGGAGPETQQSENNTLYFGSLLKEAGIEFEEDREFLLESCGEDVLTLKIKGKRETMYVGYDRWGYVVDNIEGCDDIDQASPENTLAFIVEKLK